MNNRFKVSVQYDSWHPGLRMTHDDPLGITVCQGRFKITHHLRHLLRILCLFLQQCQSTAPQQPHWFLDAIVWVIPCEQKISLSSFPREYVLESSSNPLRRPRGWRKWAFGVIHVKDSSITKYVSPEHKFSNAVNTGCFGPSAEQGGFVRKSRMPPVFNLQLAWIFHIRSLQEKENTALIAVSLSPVPAHLETRRELRKLVFS